MSNNCYWQPLSCIPNSPTQSINCKDHNITKLCKGLPSTDNTGCICKNACDELYPCKNNSTCVSTLGDYTCNCKEGYSGKNCDIIICNGVECPDNSSCVNGTCTCNKCYQSSEHPSNRSIDKITIQENKLVITYNNSVSLDSRNSDSFTCNPIKPVCSTTCEKGYYCACNKTSGDFSCTPIPKIIQGYLCGTPGVTPEKILNSGFNYVLSCFYKFEDSDGKIQLVTADNCCNPSQTTDYLKELIKEGITVGVSVGGDGGSCIGYDSSLDSASPQDIFDAFEKLRTSTGIDFSAIDIDFESCKDENCIKNIQKIGEAFYNNDKGYFVSLVPMSSQFTPQAVNNGLWNSNKILNPEYFHHVMIQWYEGNCNLQNGNWTCPKWGNSDLVNNACKTVTWNKNRFDYTTSCGMVDW